jgi:hypothetical protein
MRTYYYCTANGVSQWTMPTSAQASPIRPNLERPTSSAQLWLKDRERQQRKYTPDPIIMSQASSFHVAASSTVSSLTVAASSTASTLQSAASHTVQGAVSLPALVGIKRWKRTSVGS